MARFLRAIGMVLFLPLLFLTLGADAGDGTVPPEATGLLTALAGGSVVVAFVEVLKRAHLPADYAPLAAFVSGIGIGVIWGLAAGVGPLWGVIQGLVTGATASGMYSGGKTTVEAVRRE